MNDTPRTDAVFEQARAYRATSTGFHDMTNHASRLERENNALRSRVESASAIITELLARTAKCDCRESDDAVAAAMAWLADHK